MDKILDMLNECKPIFVFIVPVFVCAVKCLLSNAIDKVFYSKEKQLMTSIVKVIFYFFYFWFAYFAIGIIILQLPVSEPLPIDIISAVCCLIFLIAEMIVVMGYFVCAGSLRAKKWMQKRKISNYIKWICIICYLCIACSFFVLEYVGLGAVPRGVSLQREVIEGIIWISLGLAALLTFCLYISIDWLNTISPTKVYVIDEQHRKLYLIYAFDKDTIMCKLEEKAGVQRYVPMPKENIKKSILYVETGNGAVKESEFPLRKEKSADEKKRITS